MTEDKKVQWWIDRSKRRKDPICYNQRENAAYYRLEQHNRNRGVPHKRILITVIYTDLRDDQTYKVEVINLRGKDLYTYIRHCAGDDINEEKSNIKNQSYAVLSAIDITDKYDLEELKQILAVVDELQNNDEKKSERTYKEYITSFPLIVQNYIFGLLDWRKKILINNSEYKLEEEFESELKDEYDV